MLGDNDAATLDTGLPTGCLNGVADTGGPADVVQQGAAHVAPEVQDYVFRGVTLVLVRQLQAPTDV